MAADIYIQIGDIKGESKAKGFEDWIEVYSYSFGVENSASLVFGGGGGAGKATPSDLSLLIPYSKASPELFMACCTGKHFPAATMKIVKASGDSNKAFLEYDLSTVIVSQYATSLSAGGDERPVDSVALAFGKLETKYSIQDAAGRLTQVEDVTFDFIANTAP
jgi:type VI secretion system secreted protein Hcp